MATEDRDRRTRTSQTVILLPGLVALGLGLLYATGALQKTAQLRDAKVSVRDTLPLVPLEQLLALGIGVVTSSLLVVALWTFTVFVFILIAKKKPASRVIVPRRLRRRQPPGNPSTVRRVYTRISIALVAFAIISPFWNYDFFGAVTVITGVLLGVIAVRTPQNRIPPVLAAYFGVVVAAHIGSTFSEPTPLPEVTLQTADRATVRGRLIVTTGSPWYITSTDRTYSAIPSARIVHADVRSGKARQRRPILKVVWEAVSG